MNFLNLPRTDLHVSTLCFGTADLGASVDEAQSFELLDQFFEAGGNFLDSAAVYADWTPAGKGSSEKLIGKWRKTRQIEAVIATKGAHPELASMNVSRLSKAEIEADVDASLRNLGAETLDLFYLHRDDVTVDVEEILGCLEELVRAGKIRYYACSNWKWERIEAFQNAAKARGAAGFVASQPLWSLALADLNQGDQTLQQMTAPMRDFHARTQFPAIPYSSQANGYFNKLAEKRELPPTYEGAAVRAANHAQFLNIKELARHSDFSITQIVLGYLLSQPFFVVPIIGCKSAAQLEDSLSAAEVRLTSAQLAILQS
ncbi:putative oxidoreductase [Abditibacterium utsteinense]|uniref:Putative oxidoreductase n=1 Tax=Abditibacterium utsteinense TaxID=1960156 RepID=A0A2S8SWW7_9BACT|nr:aldo/keto reductase [Abditibacterium utsteinense]PQV65249.1 putative oxidoreductase [Abditibacterium utsteinense]